MVEAGILIGVCLGLLALPFLIILILLPCSCFVVRRRHAAIIERWGKFHKVATEGVHFLVPCLDRVHTLTWRFFETVHANSFHVHQSELSLIDLREQLFDLPDYRMITRDNVSITVHPMVILRITDPVRAVYEIFDISQAMSRLIQTTLRSLIGDMGLDDALASRGELNRSLLTKISQECMDWGVEITEVEILEIQPDRNIQNAMHREISAERIRRAEVVTAQGKREEAKLLAEGSCKAAIISGNAQQRVLEIEAEAFSETRKIAARAQATAVQILSEVLGPLGASAGRFIIGLRYIEAIRELVSRSSTLSVLMPYDTDMVGGLGPCLQLDEDATQSETSKTR